MPSLQGLDALTIEEQMLALRRADGQTAMHRLINAYDHAQIRGIAKCWPKTRSAKTNESHEELAQASDVGGNGSIRTPARSGGGFQAKGSIGGGWRRIRWRDTGTLR